MLLFNENHLRLFIGYISAFAVVIQDFTGIVLSRIAFLDRLLSIVLVIFFWDFFIIDSVYLSILRKFLRLMSLLSIKSHLASFAIAHKIILRLLWLVYLWILHSPDALNFFTILGIGCVTMGYGEMIILFGWALRSKDLLPGHLAISVLKVDRMLLAILWPN